MYFVTQLIQQVKGDLSKRLGVDSGEIELVQARGKSGLGWQEWRPVLAHKQGATLAS